VNSGAGTCSERTVRRLARGEPASCVRAESPRQQVPHLALVKWLQ
jgi:hypothetical protein